jgi:hypothetical protein
MAITDMLDFEAACIWFRWIFGGFSGSLFVMLHTRRFIDVFGCLTIPCVLHEIIVRMHFEPLIYLHLLQPSFRTSLGRNTELVSTSRTQCKGNVYCANHR